MAEKGFLRRGRVPPRRKRAFAVARIAFAAGAAVLFGLGAWRLMSGSLLAVRRFEVSGNRRARTEEILAVLAPYRTKNLLTLDLSPVAERLLAHPWVERVTLSKRFPDGLEVRLSERRPVALWRDGSARLVFLGADGQPIAPYDPRADGTDFVLVSGETRALADLVGLLEELRARQPEYFAALSEIDALPDAGFGMMDSIFRRPVRVLRRDASEKIAALLRARVLVKSRGWEARAIDLRFADQIVLVGAWGTGHSL
ncbi:MAG TPA: FtsQ-type POTRA domain-containing protein [Thermoanaerobaculia bacterium]|nr:FtsQ-type POTRA domain-containing protein [Thermoanaerobaculia bacterium]